MSDTAALDSLRIVLDPIGQVGIAIALLLVMFSVALGLKVENFRAIASAPAIYFGGIAAQVLLLPLLTYGLIYLLAPPPSIALGMMVVACCPGGAVSNLLTYLSKGDVAISVALTASSSLIAALLMPAATLFWAQSYAPTASLLSSLSVNPMVFVVQTTLLLALPLALGMVVAARSPLLAAKLRKRTTFAGTAVLGGVIVYGIIYFYPILRPSLGLLLSITIVHNSVAFAAGAIAGWLLAGKSSARRALTFEVGIQNSGLALVILLSQLQGIGGAAAIAAVWGIWHLIAGASLAFAYIVYDKRRSAVVLQKN